MLSTRGRKTDSSGAFGCSFVSRTVRLGHSKIDSHMSVTRSTPTWACRLVREWQARSLDGRRTLGTTCGHRYQLLGSRSQAAALGVLPGSFDGVSAPPPAWPRLPGSLTGHVVRGPAGAALHTSSRPATSVHSWSGHCEPESPTWCAAATRAATSRAVPGQRPHCYLGILSGSRSVCRCCSAAGMAATRRRGVHGSQSVGDVVNESSAAHHACQADDPFVDHVFQAAADATPRGRLQGHVREELKAPFEVAGVMAAAVVSVPDGGVNRQVDVHDDHAPAGPPPAPRRCRVATWSAVSGARRWRPLRTSPPPARSV